MKRFIPIAFIVLTIGILTTEAFGWLTPFSKARIASYGKHCVHGYDGNFGHVGVYFAGDAQAFNKMISQAGESERDALSGPLASKTVILHPGSMVVPDYVAGNEIISTDWYTSTWRGNHGGRSGLHLHIDVWLGGQIKLDKLQIPEEYTVESGGEVEEFVREVAVRIKERDAMAGGDVLQDDVAEQRALARTRLPDDVDVPARVRRAEAERRLGSVVGPFSKYDGVRVHGGGASRDSEDTNTAPGGCGGGRAASRKRDWERARRVIEAGCAV